MSVYAVLCYKVAKRGLCRVCKRRKSTPFTYNALVLLLKLDGNKRSPMRKCWHVLNSPLCTLPSARASLLALSYSENGKQANFKVSAVQRVDGRHTLVWLVLYFKVNYKHNLKILNVGTDGILLIPTQSIPTQVISHLINSNPEKFHPILIPTGSLSIQINSHPNFCNGVTFASVVIFVHIVTFAQVKLNFECLNFNY